MNMSAQDKAKTIAYVDSALLVLGLIIVAIFSIIFAFQYDPASTNSSTVRLLFIGLVFRFVIGTVLQLSLIILLLEGVMLRNYQRCWIWLITNKIFVSLMVVSALVKLFLDPVSIFAELIGIVYKIFSIRIVSAYAGELQTDSVFHP